MSYGCVLDGDIKRDTGSGGTGRGMNREEVRKRRWVQTGSRRREHTVRGYIEEVDTER